MLRPRMRVYGAHKWCPTWLGVRYTMENQRYQLHLGALLFNQGREGISALSLSLPLSCTLLFTFSFAESVTVSLSSCPSFHNLHLHGLHCRLKYLGHPLREGWKIESGSFALMCTEQKKLHGLPQSR